MGDQRRIAMFTHTLDDRAVAHVVVRVSDHLTRLGVKVAIVCGRTDAGSHPQVPEGVTVTDLRLGRTPTAFGVPRLALFLRTWRPDVIFAHGNGPNRAAVLARLISQVSTGVITVEHNHYSSYVPPTGGAWRRRWLRDLLTASLYRRADRIAGVAPSVVDDLGGRFALPRGKLVVLPNPGPEPEQIAEAACAEITHPWFSEAARPRIICSVANIIPRKGQETLIESLPQIRKQAGDVRLILVGRRDNAEYAARLERRSMELDVEEHVWFAGYRANPLSFVAKSDVFALASISEGSPLVLVEAMACGIPIVATDSPGGSSFLLDGGGAGLLVPVHDAGAMASAITRVLLDPRLRAELVACGRERANRFTPLEVAREYLALCEAVTSERPKGQPEPATSQQDA
jgi:glycosyltransferase involved in cell wall biosynthesis